MHVSNGVYAVKEKGDVILLPVSYQIKIVFDKIQTRV